MLTPASLIAPAPTVEVTEPVPNSAFTFGLAMRNCAMMFCASAGSRPARTVSTLMPASVIAFSMPPPRATAKLASGISRGLNTTSPDFRPNSLIIRLPSS
ncbi:hypothetical protein D3C86_1903410 [compost metagenome]